MKVDHHIHTSRHSPDSEILPLRLIERALAIGLDAVVITEHDYQWGPDELAELSERAGPLLVLSGAEVSTREGHFLVYGLPTVEQTPPGIELARLIEIVRAHDAAIVAAHPFRWDQPFDQIVADHGPIFDALELVSNNVSAETRTKTEDLLRTCEMGATGSSDAHDVDVIGCYYTEFPDRIETMADFVASLRSRLGRPRHRAGARLTTGPVSWR